MAEAVAPITENTNDIGGGQPGAADTATTQEQGAQAQDNAEGQQADGGEKGGEAIPVLGAPEKYELKAPGENTFDPDVLGELETVARELDLSQHAAQTIADRVGGKIAERLVAQQLENFNRVREEWKASATSDKEFGGDEEALKASLAISKKAMDAFGSDELRTFLNESGLGDHPEMIRAFVKIGKAISEDTFVGSKGAPNNAQKSIAERLYG